jgi:hypothetical protein
MRTVLHILTGPEDDVTRELLARQRALAQTKVEVVDLSKGSPDYDQLIEKIFAVESIAVS